MTHQEFLYTFLNRNFKGIDHGDDIFTLKLIIDNGHYYLLSNHSELDGNIPDDNSLLEGFDYSWNITEEDSYDDVRETFMRFIPNKQVLTRI